MGIRTSFLAPVALLSAQCAFGQGTFVFDQQSSTDETAPQFGAGSLLPNQTQQPTGTGQSFTPALSTIGFVRLMFIDAVPGDGLGATVSVTLRSGSITGPILGTTDWLRMPDGFRGPSTLTFVNPVSLVSGTTYYFEPIEAANSPPDFNNGPWDILIGQYNYAGGTAFASGSAIGPQDYWFREGIIVPEPSSVALLLFGGAALACLRRVKRS